MARPMPRAAPVTRAALSFRPPHAFPLPLGSISLLSSRLVHGLENGGNALASANAHRHHCITPADAMQFMYGLDGEHGAGPSDGMAQTDPAAVGIGLVRGQTEL